MERFSIAHTHILCYTLCADARVRVYVMRGDIQRK